MDSLFRAAGNANPNVDLWNTSSVTNMEYAFSGIAGNPNVTNFNVSNVTNFANMFRYCGSCNPNTTNWVISIGTNLAEMFDLSGIDNLNYTNFLIMADATSPFNSINVGLVPAEYQPAGVAARTNLLGPSAWTFIDNGAE